MDEHLNELKKDILREIEDKRQIYHIDFFNLEEHHFRKRLEVAFKSILKENKISLKTNEEEELFSEIISELLGLGPIDKLLKDSSISEIMVNGPHQVYVERQGTLELTDINFRDNERLLYFVEKIISPLGRRLTELEPYVDARLKDGSRVNIIGPPVSSIGPIMTIRKFSHQILNIDDLIKLGSLDIAAAEFLKTCVRARVSILISGGAASGKSTLLNILASFIPATERIIVIEDTRELSFNHNHTLYLETRLPNIEGKGEITIRELVKNALHMRPNRIIIGEVRSDEVLDMIQAMNTGHDGSMCTLHANSPMEAMDRLEVLALMGNVNLTSEVAKRQIINAVELVIHTVRFPDGSRKVTRISQMVKSREYELQDIFIFDQETGKLKSTGNAPVFSSKLTHRIDDMSKEIEPELKNELPRDQ